MKMFSKDTRQVAQGDVTFTRVDALPKGVKEAKRGPGPLVVAHSETQHHHQFTSPEVKLFEVPGDPFTCYLQLGSDAELTHLRPDHQHEAIMFGAGLVQVRRQRERTPEGYERMVLD